MKNIQDKIKQEIKKGMILSDLAFDAPFEEAQKLRVEREKAFGKVKFLKGLNNAIKKEKGEKNERNNIWFDSTR